MVGRVESVEPDPVQPLDLTGREREADCGGGVLPVGKADVGKKDRRTLGARAMRSFDTQIFKGRSTKNMVKTQLLRRNDLIFVAAARGILSRSEARGLKIGDIRVRVGVLTVSEKADLKRLQIDRTKFGKMSSSELRSRALLSGVATTGGKGDIIDRFCNRGMRAALEAPTFKLDDDQCAVVARYEEPRLIVNAGPGSGKTTTICRLIAEAMVRCPMSRILVLAFNREAASVLRHRIQAFCSDKVKLQADIEAPVALCVRTFNEFAYAVLRVQHADIPLEYDAQLVAASIVVKDCHVWDWVVVDEGQDVQNKHTGLLDSIPTRRLVVAGDPRQELYPGANWFSRLWRSAPKSERAVLSYNHRSHPQIVDLLNEYSRRAFPTLHVEQRAVRTVPLSGKLGSAGFGGVSVSTQIDGQMQADMVAAFFRGGGSGDSYAVAPVTISKFQLQERTSQLRQSIYDAHRWMVQPLDDSFDGSIDGRCVIGSSRRLKGTERARVAVYGLSAPFEMYGVPSASVKKMVYVALSRARDELFIATGTTGTQILYEPDSALAAVLEAVRVVSGVEVESKPRCPTAVLRVHYAATDLAKVLSPPHVLAAGTLPELVERADHDADFLGVLVENELASALGCCTATQFDGVQFVDNKALFDGCVVDDDNQTLAMGASKNLTELFQRLGENPSPYECALLKFSVMIRREWTVSERMHKGLDQVGRVADAVAAVVGHQHDDECKFQTRRMLRLTHHRNDKSHELLVGVTDLELGAEIVEVKHAYDQPAHDAQAAIYASMAGAPHALLCNTKTGLWRRVAAYRSGYVEDATRAVLALANGSNTRCEKARMPWLDGRRIAIVVDVETTHGMIVEVGAVAVDLSTCEYAGHYHAIGPVESIDAQCCYPCTLVHQMTGIDVRALCNCEPRLRAIHNELKNGFNEWRDTLQETALVHWGGQDAVLLRPDALPTDSTVTIDDTLIGRPNRHEHNLMSCYRDLMHINGITDSPYNLSGAAKRTLGESFQFTEHRAYEDAIATAAIFSAIRQVHDVA